MTDSINYFPHLSFQLDSDFVASYANATVSWGPVGYITFKRTYARKMSERHESYGDRTEEWHECIERVVNGVFSIQKDHCKDAGLPWIESKAKATAEAMYDAMFNFKFLPPGRGLWMMGTRYVFERTGAALYNCSFISTETLATDKGEIFEWIMDALMLGIGVGYDTLGAGKLLIPQVNSNTYTYVIPDTREGWAASTGALINAYIDGTPQPVFDYSQVRGPGMAINGFGGTSSGPDPLILLHTTIRQLWNAKVGKFIDSELIVDTQNVIGRCVVAGNVRRSAAIAIGNPEDKVFTSLKNDQEKLYAWRWNSNNTIAASVGMDYTDTAKQCTINGEPGFHWLQNSRYYGRMLDGRGNYDVKVKGVNPCAEITLENRELCNLVEIFPAHLDTFDELVAISKLAYLYNKSVTLTRTHWPKTNAVMLKNRRLGISQSGITQAIAKFGYRTFMDNSSRLYTLIKQWDESYSDWLCIPRSKKLTTVKPSGCRPSFSLVTTDQGIFTLADINSMNQADEVHSENTWEDLILDTPLNISGNGNFASKIYSNGVSQVYKITTSYNLDFYSTPNHPWFIKGYHTQGTIKGEAAFIETERLNIGQVIDVNLDLYQKTSESSLASVPAPDKVTGNRGVTLKSQPLYMTPELAWLIGYYMGDGALSPNKYRIRFTDSNIDNISKAKRIIESTFGVTLPDPIWQGESSNKECYELAFGSHHLYNWFIANGLAKNLSGLMGETIPLIIRTASRNSIYAYIAGLFDSDGCFYNSKNIQTLSLSTAYDSFAHDLQHLMFTVGLPVGRSLNSQGENKQPCKHIWLLTISRATNMENINLLQSYSNKLTGYELNLFPCTGNNSLILGKIKAIEDVGEMPTYDIEVENEHWFYDGCAKSHNTVSLLAGATPGMHYPESEFYIRRIRFANDNPMIQDFINMGYHVEPDAYGSNAMVVSFPVKEKYFTKTKFDVTIWEQVKLCADLQKYWADNSVSVTVTFKENETDQIKSVLEAFDSDLKTISFLKLSETGYVQAPYEAITEEQYYNMLKYVSDENVDKLLSNEEGVGEKYCDSTGCAIKF